MTTVPAIHIRGLVKRFGQVTALSGMDLTIERGAFFAFLGPNGAGKSTTIGVLTGIYQPDAGEVSVLGWNVTQSPLEVKSRMGVVPEELALFERLSGVLQLVFSGRMYGLTADEAQSRAQQLLQLTDLEKKSTALVADYSKGMRRRLAIACALIHAPEILLLDEPFEGIDIMASGIIRELLDELSKRGVTVLLTTHVMEIAERLASHAGIVQGGTLVAQGSVEGLKAQYQATDLEEVFEKVVGAPPSRHANLGFFPVTAKELFQA